jgi:hypothetical protein
MLADVRCGTGRAALSNAATALAKQFAAGDVAEAKAELAIAKRGYPIDLAICSGRGSSKGVAFQERYRLFRCRMDLCVWARCG